MYCTLVFGILAWKTTFQIQVNLYSFKTVALAIVK